MGRESGGKSEAEGVGSVLVCHEWGHDEVIIKKTLAVISKLPPRRRDDKTQKKSVAWAHHCLKVVRGSYKYIGNWGRDRSLCRKAQNVGGVTEGRGG